MSFKETGPAGEKNMAFAAFECTAPAAEIDKRPSGTNSRKNLLLQPIARRHGTDRAGQREAPPATAEPNTCAPAATTAEARGCGKGDAEVIRTKSPPETAIHPKRLLGSRGVTEL